MNNVTILDVENPLNGSITQHVIIDRGNGEFTSMPKAVWDELEAAKENGTMSDSV